ncbi:hypothetical protein HZC53_04080 [Candidatus Uhrbacteria bacterium]|nr:hypothetical protein [Candidatus Uhrbacteria bacterium]
MKYLIPLFAGSLLFGAGCSLPFVSPPPVQRMPAPAYPVAPPPAPVMTAPTTQTAYEAAYASAVATRKACGLKAGHYFTFIDAQGSGKLVYRANEGEYKIVADKIETDLPMGFRPICGDGQDTIILEPGSKPVLYILVATYKDEMQLTEFDLEKNVFPGVDKAESSIEATSYLLNFKIAPSEDKLLYIEDLPDYGWSLSVLDLATGAKSVFGTLPHEYSYAEAMYAPNMMADGLRAKGEVSWVDSKTVKASIYPYEATPPCETCGQKPLKAVKSIMVRTDQKEVAP